MMILLLLLFGICVTALFRLLLLIPIILGIHLRNNIRVNGLSGLVCLALLLVNVIRKEVFMRYRRRRPMRRTRAAARRRRVRPLRIGYRM